MAFKDYRKHHQEEEDRLIISRLYLESRLQADIAAHLSELRDYKISQQLLSYDLKRISQRWIKEQIDNFDEMKARELTKIDQAERNAWEAWQKSRKKTRVVVTRGRKAKAQETVERTVREEEKSGDPRYLSVVLSCVQERCKLRGLYSPQKHEINDLTFIEKDVLARRKARGVE